LVFNAERDVTGAGARHKRRDSRRTRSGCAFGRFAVNRCSCSGPAGRTGTSRYARNIRVLSATPLEKYRDIGKGWRSEYFEKMKRALKKEV
jgi:hypothetical protein